jgi:hypothetical protein
MLFSFVEPINSQTLIKVLFQDEKLRTESREKKGGQNIVVKVLIIRKQ